MKVFINRHKIERRAQLSNLVSVSGLILLLGSVVLPLFRPAWATGAYIVMIVGLGMAMTGIYFANRWVRKPRPEASLTQALKSFDDKYRLYLYPSLPCNHILLTPTGLVALEAINLAGQFSFQQGQWKEAMNMGRALRYIVEESVGNPIRSAKRLEEELTELFLNEFGSGVTIPTKTVFVFTHPGADLNIKDSPVSICRIDKLKKHVNINSAKLDIGLYEKLASFLEGKTVS